MRVAIPMIGEQFSPHFGRCEGLFLCEIDPDTRQLTRPRAIRRTATGCESLPQWIQSMGVDMVLAGGIGAGAQQLLNQMGIRYSAGHEGDRPEQVIEHFFKHTGEDLPNACGGHEHGDHEHHHCRH